MSGTVGAAVALTFIIAGTALVCTAISFKKKKKKPKLKEDVIKEVVRNSIQYLIGPIAKTSTSWVERFNRARFECEHHTFNTLTKDHNCFHGNTKTECHYKLCPLKEVD